MTWLPTRSLFWRAFLTFWGAMAAILVCGMVLTAAVAWLRFNSLDGLSPASLTRDAAQVAVTEGEPGLRRWVDAMDAHYSALKIYLLDDRDADILGRRLPARMRDWLAAYRTSPDRLQETEYARADRIPERVSWWDPHLLALPDGTQRLLLFLPFDSSHWELLSLTPVALALLLFALAVTAPLCWALTRHVAGPVALLRQTTQALSAGNLAARTPAKVAARHDEIGLLARDFNAMAERLNALVGMREQLLHSIAHELRSPLARLQLALELARNKDERQAVQLDRIERECERLDALVGNTLRLARMGALPAPAEVRDLAGIVAAVAQDARYEAAGRGVRVDCDAPGPLPVRADACSLSSAIENVLRNAVRYSPDEGTVHVRLRPAGGLACLEIRDEGPGVPESELPALFEPFYRSASAKPGTGTGLGLSIAQAAVAAHRGRIHARNAAPHGLAVSIELPIAPGAAQS